MITGEGLTIEIAGRKILDGANFMVGDGEKVGLVGKNGAGKSTLLSVVLGEPGAHLRHEGKVSFSGSYGFLPQVPVPGGLGLEPIGFSHVLSARGLDVLDEQLNAARDQMAKDPSEENINHFSDLEERYRTLGGYEAEATMARLADGLGLRQDLLFDDLDGLSGGQRRRVDLIRILFQEPEAMVLDEPTNHLDLSAKRWLFDEIGRFSGSVLVISHDLALLDRSIDKVLALADGRLDEYKGNYTKFLQSRELDISQREKASAMEEKEIKRLSQLADSMRGQTEKRAKTAKALDRRVERIQANRTETRKRESKTTFKLPVPQRAGAVPMEIQDLAVAYGPKTILKRTNLLVGRGDRVVVLGRNGVGKSSMLRCLAGVQAPTKGKIVLGANTSVGYFAQEHEQIDPELRAIDNLDDIVLKTDAERRALLGSFGLSGDKADQLPGTLSGGERAKLGLAMLAAGRNNLLLLDEPTNNLDPASVVAVGEMLARWEGTLVVVSHERAFVEALEPTHAVLLPQEFYDLWHDNYLDEVEQR